MKLTEAPPATQSTSTSARAGASAAAYGSSLFYVVIYVLTTLSTFGLILPETPLDAAMTLANRLRVVTWRDHTLHLSKCFREDSCVGVVFSESLNRPLWAI